MDAQDVAEAQRLIAAFRHRWGGAHGWQRRLAEQLGVHETFISKLVNNETKSPGYRLLVGLRRIASVERSPTSEVEVIRAIEQLDDDARGRVLTWARSRWP